MKNLREKIFNVSLITTGIGATAAMGLTTLEKPYLAEISCGVGLIGVVGMLTTNIIGSYQFNRMIKEQEDRKQEEKFSLQLNAGTDYYGE